MFDSENRGVLVKNILLVAIFFTVTPITLLASGVSLISLSNTESLKNVSPEASHIGEPQKALIYSSYDHIAPSVSTEIVAGDARPQLVYDYLKKNKSPLLAFSDKIVEVADKYGLDYRLLPAIAQKESGLCRVIPPGSHNCWGWGIHSKGTLMFDSYDEAIEVVTKGLREKYFDEGYVTPDQIMKKYAHKDSTTWADGVNMYMEQME